MKSSSPAASSAQVLSPALIMRTITTAAGNKSAERAAAASSHHHHDLIKITSLTEILLHLFLSDLKTHEGSLRHKSGPALRAAPRFPRKRSRVSVVSLWGSISGSHVSLHLTRGNLSFPQQEKQKTSDYFLFQQQQRFSL